MKIKQLIFTVLMLVAGCAGAQAQSIFQYPIVPDSITSFQERCDFLAEHFFDYADLQKAFSNRSKMGEEFRTYLTIVANAHPKVAAREAAALMKKLEKQPKDQLQLATIAEGTLYGDTAQMWIDELYLPFAEAIAANKRMDKAEKARFAHQARLLRNSMVGATVPALQYTRTDGTQSTLQADSSECVVLFFNDPDCSDCNMARLRLSADISTNELIKEGKFKIVAISLSEPDDEWRRFAASMPEEWTVGAAPDADLTFDLRAGTPDFYILGRRGKIRFKHLDVNQVLDISRQLKRR